MRCLPEWHIEKPKSLPLYHQAEPVFTILWKGPSSASCRNSPKPFPASQANTSTDNVSEEAMALGDQTADTQSRGVSAESFRVQTTQVLSQTDATSLSCSASNIWNIYFAWTSNQTGDTLTVCKRALKFVLNLQDSI